ncbi:MAG TPA: PadR family transcriptional regulator [Jiangellaceae bacterium]|jgi:PadR family transcriptional regulator PadR|nr:PadR family transcriptional regulator [Jiangellaceae bacterium]
MVPSDGEFPHGTLDSRLLTNLRRGALEYCVLALLRHGESYGLDIAHALSADGVLITSEGTLYPLLSRLRKSGLVATSWRESAAGPPRRYYKLTAEGMAALAAFERTWEPFRNAVDRALKGAR